MEPERSNGAVTRIRDWPKLSVSVSPNLLAVLTSLAARKGYSLSEAARVALEEVGVAYLEQLPARSEAAQ